MHNKHFKTAVLDWATVSSNNDITPEEIYSPGEIKFYDLTDPSQTVSRIKDCEAVLCNKVKITAQIISQCPSLRYIGLFATGYNNIDLDAANAAGITVCNAGSYSTDAVAQLTFAMILTHYCSIPAYTSDVKNNAWINSATFSMLCHPMSELSSKTISVIGYGSIGRAVAKIASAFNMNVLVHTRTTPEDCPYRLVSIEEAFSAADIITFHCPLTPQTQNLVNQKHLGMMKKSALVVNTSRGGVVDEKALADALGSGTIAGACLDVLNQEPMSADTPLRDAKNCLITPHIAWAPLETRQRLISIVNNNLRSFIEGNPSNVINSPHK
ncbi:MAG: D-2-hydroxyacid dehydrogenase [Oscillospiraceae bacterium]|nr:D-2-hydroxyacid dehydrogenase [Oscillospiraceae bacterium]